MRSLERLVAELALLNKENLSSNILTVFENQLELIYRELVCLETLGDLRVSGEEISVVQLVREALDEFRSLLSHPSNSGYEAVVTENALVGRPRYCISKSQREFLLQSKFTVPQIVSLLNVSVRTVRRRMDEYGLSVRRLYSNISDQDIDVIV